MIPSTQSRLNDSQRWGRQTGIVMESWPKTHKDHLLFSLHVEENQVERGKFGLGFWKIPTILNTKKKHINSKYQYNILH